MDINFDLFANPTAEYRAKPFWALNGKLEKRHLKFQIECMKEMGFGGAFLHSRTGLSTEYMSEEWLDYIAYASEILHENGMQAYLYDEDRWPSGTCGGLVTKTKEFQAKAMVYVELTNETDALPNNLLGLFSVRFEGKKACAYRKLTAYEKTDDERVFAFYYIHMQGDSFYNGYTYLDTMNLAATKRFIQLTHEAYKQAMGDMFGKQIMGIFTDEPHRNPLLNGFGRKEAEKEKEIPYTYALFDEFAKRKGYRIEDCLPVLWFGKSDREFCKEMYDLIEVEQQLFLENFAKPYYDWCQENRLVVTGHVLHEDNLAAQTTMCGSVMRYYEYMDYPGMDNLCELNYAYPVPKLVSSVARQLGKEFVLDELYAATGWKMRLADYKHTGNWQSATGVTLRCPHLSWYTMKGEAKRDYPASILHQSAWYKEYRSLEDYFSRMHYLLKCGESLTQAAILNPVESVWGLTDGNTYVNCFLTTSPLYQKIEREYFELYKGLLLQGINVDYIDEGLFAKYGSVSRDSLVCGKASYRKIILNGNLNLRKTTYDALCAFVSNGGEVILVGDAPEYLDGEQYDFSAFLESVTRLPFDLAAVGARLQDDELPVSANEGLIVVKRKVQDGYLVFLLNSEKEKSIDAQIHVKTHLIPVKLNLRTGKKEYVSYEKSGEYTLIEQMLDRDEELMLYFSSEGMEKPAERIWQKAEMPRQFEYALDEDNYLVLDRPKCYIDGQLFAEDFILNLDKAVRGKFGLEERNVEMIQPWFKKKFLSFQDKKYCRVALQYTFTVKEIPQKIALMAEDLEESTISLNGCEIAVQGAKETLLDNAFKVLELPADQLTVGKNVLCIQFDFYERRNLEGCFLAGEFGVEYPTDAIVSLPKKLTDGDLREQGLPYYGGKISMWAPMENGRYCLHTKEIHCACMHIGNDMLIFPPYAAETTIEDGLLHMQLVCTRNNLFGCVDDKGEHGNLLPYGILLPIKVEKEV